MSTNISSGENQRKFRLARASILFFLLLSAPMVPAADLPVVRIAHGAFNEKIAALWVAVEQGFYRRQGVNVEVINIRSGRQTMAVLAHGAFSSGISIPARPTHRSAVDPNNNLF